MKNILAILGLVLLTSCGTETIQKASFQTVGTVKVSAEQAIREYDAYAAQGKTTVQQNAQVKALYVKYQAAYAVVCDAGSIYAASSITNSNTSAAVVTQAISVASQTLTDLENLIVSFGVKL